MSINDISEWIPQACTDLGLMNDLIMCFVEEPLCLENCFPREGTTPEFFRLPDDLDLLMGDCAEFEEPVCMITECRHCTPCATIINDLYRCVVNEMRFVEPQLKLLVNCPLDCSGDSFLLNSGNFTDDVDGDEVGDAGGGNDGMNINGADDLMLISEDDDMMNETSRYLWN